MDRNDGNDTTPPVAGKAAAAGTRNLRRNGGESRSRMSLTVDGGLGNLIQQAKAASGCATASKAIRWALRKALAPQPPRVALGLEILQWAERLKFTSGKEQWELRDLAKRLYEQISGTSE